jgi:hypothetical protein
VVKAGRIAKVLRTEAVSRRSRMRAAFEPTSALPVIADICRRVPWVTLYFAPDGDREGYACGVRRRPNDEDGAARWHPLSA